MHPSKICLDTKMNGAFRTIHVEACMARISGRYSNETVNPHTLICGSGSHKYICKSGNGSVGNLDLPIVHFIFQPATLALSHAAVSYFHGSSYLHTYASLFWDPGITGQQWMAIDDSVSIDGRSLRVLQHRVNPIRPTSIDLDLR